MGISRRAAIAAVSLLSAVCLAACGGSASNSSTGAASAGTSGGAGKATGKVTVLAAASLQKAFEEIEKTVEKDNPGLDVTFDFQGSQDLVASLAGGDSADVLATANNSTMKTAADQKLVGSQTEFATNVLTLIVPKGNPKRITGLDSSLDGANLVICAPEVPCGEATKKLAEAQGITLKPVSEEQKVTDVRGKVESGEADAGIVYTTDAAAAKDKTDKIDIPDGASSTTTRSPRPPSPRTLRARRPSSMPSPARPVRRSWPNTASASPAAPLPERVPGPPPQAVRRPTPGPAPRPALPRPRPRPLRDRPPRRRTSPPRRPLLRDGLPA